MFTSKTSEVSGANQAALEALYLRHIHTINDTLRRFYATYNDWDHADERLRAHYTREQYREQFIDYWLGERHTYIIKLRDIRRGVTHD